jgi:methionyl-tRNA formyltransferase
MLDAEGYPRAFIEFGPFRVEFTRALLKKNILMAKVKIILK